MSSDRVVEIEASLLSEGLSEPLLEVVGLNVPKNWLHSGLSVNVVEKRWRRPM